MNEELTLEKDKELFLKKEYEFFTWMYDSYDTWVIDFEEDLEVCEECKSYYWEGCKKMCGHE